MMFLLFAAYIVGMYSWGYAMGKYTDEVAVGLVLLAALFVAACLMAVILI